MSRQVVWYLSVSVSEELLPSLFRVELNGVNSQEITVFASVTVSTSDATNLCQRQRQKVPPKHLYLYAKPHGVTCQKAITFLLQSDHTYLPDYTALHSVKQRRRSFQISGKDSSRRLHLSHLLGPVTWRHLLLRQANAELRLINHSLHFVPDYPLVLYATVIGTASYKSRTDTYYLSTFQQLSHRVREQIADRFFVFC